MTGKRALRPEPPRWRQSAPIVDGAVAGDRDSTSWRSRLDYSCARHGLKPGLNCCSSGVRGLIVSPAL